MPALLLKGALNTMRKRLLASAFMVALPFTAGAVPVTFDAVADFSTASNPNGVWSYGYGTPGGSGLTFTAFTAAGSSYGSPAWELPNLPLVGQAYTGGTVAVPASELWMHPGNADDLAAILRFTAPFAGSYNLTSLFQRADVANGGGNGTAVSVYVDGSRAFASTLSTTYGASYTATGVVDLVAGSTLSFVVDRNGEYSYDSTGVRVSLSADAPTLVPEPASLALLGLGAAGVAAVRRRRAA